MINFPRKLYHRLRVFSTKTKKFFVKSDRLSNDIDLLSLYYFMLQKFLWSLIDADRFRDNLSPSTSSAEIWHGRVALPYVFSHGEIPFKSIKRPAPVIRTEKLKTAFNSS